LSEAGTAQRGQWRHDHLQHGDGPRPALQPAADHGPLHDDAQRPLRLSAANVVAFQVEDWQPRTLPVYHATGTTGGYYTQEPVPRPPGGVFRYKFTSPNSVTLQDTNLGGAVTFNRVR